MFEEFAFKRRHISLRMCGVFCVLFLRIAWFQGIRIPSLRDEIFTQLVNQTWGNGVEASVDRGWCLLALCMSCFRPSETMGKYLIK
jgi:hypothetical protein